MKQRKMTNKQHNRRNLSPWIYKKDLANRQAESQKEERLQKEERSKKRWKTARWCMFFYMNIAFWLIVFFNIETKWTVANLTVALVGYTVTSCIALVIGRVAMYKKYEKVLLNNDRYLGSVPFYDIETPTSDDTNMFTEISDKQIVIEVDSMSERWVITFLSFIMGGGYFFRSLTFMMTLFRKHLHCSNFLLPCFL